MGTIALHVPAGGWPVPTPGLTTGCFDDMRRLGPYSRPGVDVVRVVCVKRTFAEKAVVCALGTQIPVVPVPVVAVDPMHGARRV